MKLLAITSSVAQITAAAATAPPPPPPPPAFGFSPVFGDWMVLQQAPAAAAVYGTAPAGASAVTVTVTDTSSGKSYAVAAKVGADATHQPRGYVDPSTGAQLPLAQRTWKALLQPAVAGGDYTVAATCSAGCSAANASSNTAMLAHATFGDMWYCSGQSNMWLPVEYSLSRNASVDAIVKGKYANIRGMFSPSATTPTAGVWKTAAQAIADGNASSPTYSLFDMGAACWYFAQGLVQRGVTTPIGIADTAIGGQRIEEFMNNATTFAGGAKATPCPDAVGGAEVKTAWNGQLFAKQVMPFVDMSVKGWTWFQGENNMQNVKGNAADNVGYSCKQRELVRGWRAIWSEVAGTTDPLAPFGLVTLASSGSEGGPNMGAMRLAQTAGHGVLPNSDLPATFFAQAGDLEDVWGPAAGPCFSSFPSQWGCCDAAHRLYAANRSSASCRAGTRGHPELCDPACAAAAGTRSMGGIHPRSKRPVGERLAAAAYNSVYGGKVAATGPTLASCALAAAQAGSAATLTIEFNATLLRGEKVVLTAYNASLNNAVAAPPPLPAGYQQCFDTVKTVCADHLHNYTDCRNCKTDVPGAWDKLMPACGSRPIDHFHESCKSFFPADMPLRGSLVEVLVGAGAPGADGGGGAAAFCLEPMAASGGGEVCPPWAGPPDGGAAPYNRSAGSWLTVDILAAGASSVTVDLSALNGSQPAGVRYSWGVFDCCNTGDPALYVGKPCDNACPITASGGLPANPFMAKISKDGKCACVAPQVC